MSVFDKDYADVYDNLYKHQQYIDEVKTVVALSKWLKSSHKIDLLDLGCGTGNHAQYFKETFNVVGVDISEAMLAKARTKVNDVQFLQGDARNFELKREFDIVCMMSAVLGYQHTNDDVIETMDNVRRHLKLGGLFIFDVWYGPSILCNNLIPRIREASGVLRSMHPTLYSDDNLVRCDYKWWVPTETKFESYEESHTQRYFFIPEIKMMLQHTGFELWWVGKPGGLVLHSTTEQIGRDIMFAAKAVG